MNKKALTQMSNQLFRKLKKSSRKVKATVNLESIHQYRVTYKKLRAYLRMLTHQKRSAGAIKINKKLSIVFKISGRIRDVQLQQQRILNTTKQHTIKKPVRYLFLLEKESNQLKEELFKIIDTKAVTDNKEKTTTLLPGKFSIKKFRNFLNQQWNSIDTILLSGNFSDDNIHSIRKSLKDIFFNLKIYEKTKHGMLTNSIWRGKNEAYFTTLLTELGNSQDKFTGISFLKNKEIKNLDKFNQEQVNKIKKVWQKEKAAIKKALLIRLKNDFATVEKSVSPISPIIR